MPKREPRGPAPEDAPFLDGWVTLGEAAERLGTSRQNMDLLAKDRQIRTLHRVGKVRSWRLLRESELPELRELLNRGGQREADALPGDAGTEA